jgi:hypothetical protein
MNFDNSYIDKNLDNNNIDDIHSYTKSRVFCLMKIGSKLYTKSSILLN